jgi:hypothetical protein
MLQNIARTPAKSTSDRRSRVACPVDAVPNSRVQWAAVSGLQKMMTAALAQITSPAGTTKFHPQLFITATAVTRIGNWHTRHVIVGVLMSPNRLLTSARQRGHTSFWYVGMSNLAQRIRTGVDRANPEGGPLAPKV